VGTRMIRFRVIGKNTFPIDMLRYDQCWPMNPECIGNIVDSISLMEYPVTTYELCSYKAPTVARWNTFAFGCRVVD
jgi:hypothetical protein